MMKKIEEFDNEKPFFKNGDFNWYVDEYFKDIIETKQQYNLPKLENIMCFVVINKPQKICDYVLITNTQEIIASYKYSFEGAEQMDFKIKAIKISKHFDDEEANI